MICNSKTCYCVDCWLSISMELLSCRKVLIVRHWNLFYIMGCQ